MSRGTTVFKRVLMAGMALLLLAFSMRPVTAQNHQNRGYLYRPSDTEVVDRALKHLTIHQQYPLLSNSLLEHQRVLRQLLSQPRAILTAHRELVEEQRLRQEALFPKIRIIDPNKPMVALTFDDGPRPSTNRVFASLKKYNVVATFFVIGMYVNGKRDLLRQMTEAGNEIGNHSWSHLNLREITAEEVEAQIRRTDDAIVRATSVYPAFVRPPMGLFDSKLRSVIGNRQIALWSIDTLDWKHKDWQLTMASIRRVQDGDIILIHDLVESTASNIEEMIVYLVEQGYQLVTLSELVKYRQENQRVVRYARP